MPRILRLAPDDEVDLDWYFRLSAADVSGIRAQSYDPRIDVGPADYPGMSEAQRVHVRRYARVCAALRHVAAHEQGVALGRAIERMVTGPAPPRYVVAFGEVAAPFVSLTGRAFKRAIERHMDRVQQACARFASMPRLDIDTLITEALDHAIRKKTVDVPFIEAVRIEALALRAAAIHAYGAARRAVAKERDADRRAAREAWARGADAQ